jgi:Fe-S cluster biogenesis protein NfuA
MLKDKVEKAIQEIRPFLQYDGGDLELVDVSEDGVVKVRLHGACAGCPSAGMTMSQGVEIRLRERIPEVKKVMQVY